MALPLLAALVGMVAVAALFWPGYLSFDSAYQWWQARNDQFESTHPPLLAMLWQVSARLLPAPGGMLLLQLALYWLALGLFAAQLPIRAHWRAAVVLLMGLWPPLLGLQVHLWKDLWTLIGFALAAACLLRDLNQPGRRWRLLAVLAIAFACAFRHNAISGALPLLLWIAWRETGAWRPLRIGLLGAVLAVVVLLLAGLPERDPRVRQVQQVWSVVTLWDATAVSIAEQRMLIPELLRQPSLSLEELEEKFSDYSNTTVFELGKLRHSLSRPYEEEERRALYRLAWELPVHHPRAYFSHRLRLAQLLFGLDRQALPAHQVLTFGHTKFRDNPPLAESDGERRQRAEAALRAAMQTPLFSGWIYLALSAGLMLLPLLRPAWRSESALLASLLAASSLAYALPLALASGSAEFRYLAWPIWASLAALALWIGATGPKAPAGSFR